MNTYPGNSHKSKDVKKTAPTDEKKIQKRVSKPAKTKKKGELRKIAEEFIVDDVKNIKCSFSKMYSNIRNHQFKIMSIYTHYIYSYVK